MCQENLIPSTYLYSLRVFPSPHSKGLAHTWVRLPEDTFSPHLLWRPLGMISCRTLCGGSRGGGEGEGWLEKREVESKKANSFCRTEKGTGRAGWEWWGSVSFSLGGVGGERLVAQQGEDSRCLCSQKQQRLPCLLCKRATELPNLRGHQDIGSGHLLADQCGVMTVGAPVFRESWCP